jgi:capsular polysaccharide biosynthesis protein
MYELADRAVALTLDGKSTEIIESIGETEIQRVINESDKKSAKKIVKDLLPNWIDSNTYQRILKSSPITALKNTTLQAAWGI